MNRTRRPSRKKQEKKGSAKSAVYIVILIVALGLIAFFFLGEFNFRNSFNTVVNELDSGFQSQDEKLIKDCMEKLESLKNSNLDKKERLDPINDNLLKCYRHFSGNPGISHKERLVYLKKISEIAPNSLSKMDKKLLEN